MPRSRILALWVSFAFIVMASLLMSCDSTPKTTEAVALPMSLVEPIDVAGTRWQALAYLNQPPTGGIFGFDIRGAGLLPVLVSIDNRGGGALKIIPRQTFLIDSDGQAWPLLTTDQALSRLDSANVTHAGERSLSVPTDLETITGFALNTIHSVGFSNLADAYTRPESGFGEGPRGRNLRNPLIPAGEAASSLLFFPGREEAKSVRGLRLCYEQNKQLHCLMLPLKTLPD